MLRFRSCADVFHELILGITGASRKDLKRIITLALLVHEYRVPPIFVDHDNLRLPRSTVEGAPNRAIDTYFSSVGWKNPVGTPSCF